MEVMDVMPESGKDKPLTWEEARVGFQPAELVRGDRTLTVEYRWQGSRWAATSPDLDGFEVCASSLSQLKTAARAVLDDWLDPAVQVREIVVGQGQPSHTRTARSRHRWPAVRVLTTLFKGKHHEGTWRSAS
jgi:hypothetical protein